MLHLWFKMKYGTDWNSGKRIFAFPSGESLHKVLYSCRAEGLESPLAFLTELPQTDSDEAE